MIFHDILSLMVDSHGLACVWGLVDTPRLVLLNDTDAKGQSDLSDSWIATGSMEDTLRYGENHHRETECEIHETTKIGKLKKSSRCEESLILPLIAW